jgi:hypothetical protein
MVNNYSGYNPIGYSEYTQAYNARPYMTFNSGLQPGAYQPLPSAINVPDLIDPASDPEYQMQPQQNITLPPLNSFGKTDFSKIGSLDSLFSFGSSAGATQANISAATSSITNLSNLGSFSSVGLGAPSTIGASTAGAAKGAATSAATATTGGALSGAVAGGLAGIGGVMAANVLGFEGGYSNIGGAVGGAIGTIWGPLGTAAGSFIGSAIGSALGPGDPAPASVVGSNYGITSAGTFARGGVTRSKHIDTSFASNMQGMIDRFNTSIHQQTGLDLSQTINTLYAGYDKEHGPAFISYNGYYKKDHEHHNPKTSFTFDPNNKQSMVQAFRNYGSSLLQDTGQNFDPVQIQSIVDNALQTLSTEETSSNMAGGRGDVLIDRKVEQGNKFTEFLQEYNNNYNKNKA